MRIKARGRRWRGCYVNRQWLLQQRDRAGLWQPPLSMILKVLDATGAPDYSEPNPIPPFSR
jgi:hypothetical protein